MTIRATKNFQKLKFMKKYKKSEKRKKLVKKKIRWDENSFLDQELKRKGWDKKYFVRIPFFHETFFF